jgi:hypothetical protein
MDPVNVVWAAAFVVLLAAVNVTTDTISKSLKGKPLGVDPMNLGFGRKRFWTNVYKYL